MQVFLRRRKVKGGIESLYLDYYHNGKRKTETLNLHLTGDRAKDKQTLDLAEAIRAQRMLEFVAAGEDLDGLLNFDRSFIQYARENVKKKPFMKRVTTLKVLEHYLDGAELTFKQVTPDWWNAFGLWLATERGNKPNTVFTHLISLRAILNDAVNERLIKSNPLKAIRVKQEPKKRAFLTLAEFERLRETKCDSELIRNAFLFCCYTGLRRGDLFALRWENIKDGRIGITQGKTGNIVYIPLGERAAEILNAIPKKLPFVFNDLPKHKDTVNKVISRWCLRAGIDKHITFHSARHTFATLLITMDVDIYTVSKLLGHASVKTTEIYAKVINKKLDEAVSKLP